MIHICAICDGEMETTIANGRVDWGSIVKMADGRPAHCACAMKLQAEIDETAWRDVDLSFTPDGVTPDAARRDECGRRAALFRPQVEDPSSLTETEAF